MNSARLSFDYCTVLAFLFAECLAMPHKTLLLLDGARHALPISAANYAFESVFLRFGSQAELESFCAALKDNMRVKVCSA